VNLTGVDISDDTLRQNIFNWLLLSLPKPNLLLFHRVHSFLNKVALHSKRNKMTLENLATIMAPSLFRVHGNPYSMVRSNTIRKHRDQIVEQKHRCSQAEKTLLYMLQSKFVSEIPFQALPILCYQGKECTDCALVWGRGVESLREFPPPHNDMNTMGIEYALVKSELKVN
jgi:hypothetical protein